MNLLLQLFILCLGVHLSSVFGQDPPDPPEPEPEEPEPEEPEPEVPLLPYLSVCRNDAECDPYTSLEAYRLKCDKMSPLNDTGICGCVGDAFKFHHDPLSMRPMSIVNPNSPTGYNEKFEEGGPNQGCRRTFWTGAPCPVGSTSCDQLGIYSGSTRYGEHVICRNVLPEDSLVKEYRCVGKERTALTFGNCGPTINIATDYKVGAVDCSSFIGLRCMDVRMMDVFACLPAMEEFESFFCHHDTDCKDPNAVCTHIPAFTEDSDIPGEPGFSRHFCICDKEQGYLFSFLEGQVKCIPSPEYGQVCNSALDCVGLTPFEQKYILCQALVIAEPGSSFQTIGTCQCSSLVYGLDPTGTMIIEVTPVIPLHYFEGAYKETAECALVVDFDAPCNPNYKLDRELQPVHNCRQLSGTMELTHLRCSEAPTIPRCRCAESSEWNPTVGRCLRKYVDLDEECGVAGSEHLPCNPLGHLKCEQALGTTKGRCVCTDLAFRDPDGFAYCRLIVRTVGYGEPCDDVTDYCNNDQYQLCVLGTCVCFTDEEIVDTGTECRFSNPSASNQNVQNKTSGATTALIQIHVVPVLPLLMSIAFQ